MYFSDNPPHLLAAYVENGEGIDRAGGFAIQVHRQFYPTLPYYPGILELRALRSC